MSHMTVKELVKELQSYPESAHVILSKDADGNRFSPLNGLESVLYMADTPWSGDIWELDDDELPEDPSDLVFAVCLWPES